MTPVCTSLLIFAVLLTVAKIAAKINASALHAQEHVRKIQVHNAKLTDQAQRHRERDEAKTDRAALREARLAEQHNKVMLQEMKIEAEALKLEALKRKLGTGDEFAPADYGDETTPTP